MNHMMNTRNFLPLLFPLLLSCMDNKPRSEQDNDFEDGYYTRNEAPMAQEPEEEKGFWNRLSSQQNAKQTHHLRDAHTGLVVGSTQFPSQWKVISRPIYTMDQKVPTFLIQMEGPNNFKSFNVPTTFKVSYQNPEMAQSMKQLGMGPMMRPLVRNEVIFKEEVNPRMEKSGFRLLGNKPVAEFESVVRSRMQEAGVGNAHLECSATEWTNQKGEKALARIVKIAHQQPGMNNDGFTLWFYNVDYIFVDKDHFESALDQMVEVDKSYTENPEWRQYLTNLSNQRAQEAQRQWQNTQQLLDQNQQYIHQSHQQRMNDRWASFNAHKEKMKGIYAAQDANHAAFMNRNFGAGSDTQHKRYINTIRGEETVYNPQTGSNYQVNAGSMEYWMDSQGNYIENNDVYYTPNGDINLNQREWTKVKKAF